MKSFPHYSQHDVMDCGPTCLRMVSAFYGKRYSLEGLREKSFITREGVSMLGISEAAEKIGFRSICVQVSYEMLQEAPLPCIVHWNQQHFRRGLPDERQACMGGRPRSRQAEIHPGRILPLLAQRQNGRRRYGSGTVAGTYTGILCTRR